MGRREAPSIVITAPRDECVAVLLDVERYPEWSQGVVDARVLERDSEGLPACVFFASDAAGRQSSYTLRYDLSGVPAEVRATLLEGEGMRSLESAFELEPDGLTTRVTYLLAMEFSLPVPGPIRRRMVRQLAESRLAELKSHVETLAGG